MLNRMMLLLPLAALAMTAACESTGSSTAADPPPELVVRPSGETEVRFSSGCTTLYDPQGNRAQAGSSCSPSQLAHSDDAVRRYRREQGLDAGAGAATAAAGSPDDGLPRVNATCPLGISVHADQNGPVFINAQEAELEKFSESFYEARKDDITISLSINPDRTVSVSYDKRGAGNGICTVT